MYERTEILEFYILTAMKYSNTTSVSALNQSFIYNDCDNTEIFPNHMYTNQTELSLTYLYNKKCQ